MSIDSVMTRAYCRSAVPAAGGHRASWLPRDHRRPLVGFRCNTLPDRNELVATGQEQVAPYLIVVRRDDQARWGRAIAAPIAKRMHFRWLGDQMAPLALVGGKPL